MGKILALVLPGVKNCLLSEQYSKGRSAYLQQRAVAGFFR
jgi:hypothetical protein